MIRCGNRRKDNEVGKKCRGNEGKVNDGRSASMRSRIMCEISNYLTKRIQISERLELREERRGRGRR